MLALSVFFPNAVKPVLSLPPIKLTPSIKGTPT